MTHHALIIGIDKFGLDRNVRPLRYAEADAHATHQVFQQVLGYGENAHLLLQPNLSMARRALHAVGEQVRAGDTFVFYFAGHGATSLETNLRTGSRFEPVVLEDVLTNPGGEPCR